jgi:hypothetical protein
MATFDPNSITPPEELLEEWYRSPQDPLVNDDVVKKDYIVAARWGAAQAAEALRHQWPEPITDRPPTEEDGDEFGFVQYLYFGGWTGELWSDVARNLQPAWLHTPSWRPKPEPTLKQQAIEILDTVFPLAGCTSEQAETLRAALALIPEED